MYSISLVAHRAQHRIVYARHERLWKRIIDNYRGMIHAVLKDDHVIRRIILAVTDGHAVLIAVDCDVEVILVIDRPPIADLTGFVCRGELVTETTEHIEDCEFLY